MSESLLQISDLSVLFAAERNPFSVVDHLSLDVRRAEVFGLVGESGCGKSMTALAVMGLLPPGAHAGGSIRFDGRELLKLPPDEMRAVRGRDIAMIFQEPMTSLNPVLTVGYQIAEAILVHERVTKGEARDRAAALLEAVRIPDAGRRLKDYPHQLSGGMRQRVMIAMAIACNPSLLIADEPTTALDVTIQAQILELLQSLRKERRMAVLLITHDLSIIAEQADRVAVMYAGRVVELASVRDLFTNTLHPYTIGLIASLPGAKGVALKPVRGMVPAPGMLPKGCTFSDRCPRVIEACHAEEPELREITPQHWARCIRAGEA